MRALYFLLPLLLSGLSLRAQDVNIAFVNLDRVFNEYYKTKLADAQLKEQMEEFKAERSGMHDEYLKLQEEFNKLRESSTSMLLSDEERTRITNEAAEKLSAIREMEKKLRSTDDTRRNQIEEQGRRMRKRIVDEIMENIRTYATSRGLDAVIDSSGQSLNGVPMVIFADTRVDITDTIVEYLNKKQLR